MLQMLNVFTYSALLWQIGAQVLATNVYFTNIR
jgi:hypothetical protein